MDGSEDTGAKIIVTGDYSKDRFIYLEEFPNKPANLREAWVTASRFWDVVLDGGSGALMQCLIARGMHAVDPCCSGESRAESIYILTRRQNDGRGEKPWCIGQSLVAGEREYFSGDLKACPPELLEGSCPAIIVDFNQGWVMKNMGMVPKFLKNRPYIVRTHDPLREEWANVRRQGIGPGLWFSPIQDMADGSLWFQGNWESVRDRLIGYLKIDATLWDSGRWVHYIVVQISYDGVLLLGPDLDEKGEIFIYSGDQPGSFQREGHGTVVAGGIVFAYSLTPVILSSPPFQKDHIIQCVRTGLARLREVVRRGYVGPAHQEKDWQLQKKTNLPLEAIDRPPTDDIVIYSGPPAADWQSACAIVTGDDRKFREHTVFRLGQLVTVSPDYAHTLLRLTSMIDDHVAKGKGVFSFSVFGGPGSGKSFVAKQVKGAVDPKGEIFQKEPLFEVNLSQFNDPARLIDTFKEVQTTSLKGKIPFVIWDEFDTYYQRRQAGWLPRFLMPMQDAKFFDGIAELALGTCVFVFIGGTFKDEKSFDEWATTKNGQILKGPDFHSRLKSSLTVPAADFKEKQSISIETIDEAKLVRAILIRSFLKKEERTPRIRRISKEALAYLLHVPLKHGVRSLETIVANSELSKTSYFQTFHLPHVNVLKLHVDESKTASACSIVDFLKEIGFMYQSPERPVDLEWRA